MGAEMCTGVRKLPPLEDPSLNIQEIFGNSVYYRKIDGRRIRKKVRKLQRKVQEYKDLLEQHEEHNRIRKISRNAARRNLQ